MADIASLVLKVDATSVKDADKALNGLEKQAGETEKSAAELMRAFTATTAVLATTILVIKNSVKAATEYQNALTGLASVARYAGEDIQNTLGTATALTADGMLSTGEAATAMKNLLAKGFNTQQAVEMITRLKDAAAFGKQGSLEFGQAVLSATEGIKNENSVLVDNAGVTKNISVMQKEYAASVQKTVEKLSEAEKREAVYAGLMRETEGQLGNAALAAQGMQGASARMDKTLNDSAITIGQTFMPAAVALTNALTTGLQGAMDFGIRPFLFMFEDIGITAGELMMKMGVFGDYMSSPSRWLNPAKAQAEMKAQFKIYEAIAEQSRIELAARLAGGVVAPNIGKDTGKRRGDVSAVAAIKKGKDDEFKLENEAWIREKEFQIAKANELRKTAEKSAKEIADANEKEAKRAQQSWERFTGNVQRNLGDVLYNGLNGNFKNIGDAFKQMLMRMSADAAAAQLTQAMFGSASGGGAFGSFGAKIGGFFGAPAASSSGGGASFAAVDPFAGTGYASFAGGGFTGSGSRSGGVDGMGGFPAILHPNETVVDHTKGQAAGASVTVVQNINIDSRSDASVIIAAMTRAKDMAKAEIMSSLQRGGDFAAAVGRA